MENLKNKISFLITLRNIVINFEGKTFIVSKEAQTTKYDAIKEAFKAHDYEKVIGIIIPKERIVKYANEFFVVGDKGVLFMKDDETTPVAKVIGATLMDFVNEELPLDPLINFWKKLRNNPLETAREDLYRFLEHNHHPLTPDGNFIAYKRVNATENGKLVDNYSKTIDNSVGAIVKMKREDVDSNRNNTCSRGLHVAAWTYAQTYSGDTLIEVLVNPEDVVSVPTDYNNQKMRVCRYQVLNIVGEERDEVLAKNVKSEKKINKSTVDKAVINTTKKQVSFEGQTAKQIIQIVKDAIGEEITMSLKNKQPIIKKATKMLEDQGWKVK